jgi:hypothetical protein
MTATPSEIISFFQLCHLAYIRDNTRDATDGDEDKLDDMVKYESFLAKYNDSKAKTEGKAAMIIAADAKWLLISYVYRLRDALLECDDALDGEIEESVVYNSDLPEKTSDMTNAEFIEMNKVRDANRWAEMLRIVTVAKDASTNESLLRSACNLCNIIPLIPGTTLWSCGGNFIFTYLQTKAEPKSVGPKRLVEFVAEFTQNAFRCLAGYAAVLTIYRKFKFDIPVFKTIMVFTGMVNLDDRLAEIEASEDYKREKLASKKPRTASKSKKTASKDEFSKHKSKKNKKAEEHVESESSEESDEKPKKSKSKTKKSKAKPKSSSESSEESDEKPKKSKAKSKKVESPIVAGTPETPEPVVASTSAAAEAPASPKKSEEAALTIEGVSDDENDPDYVPTEGVSSASELDSDTE